MAESSSAAAPEEDEEESGLLNAVDAVPFMVHVLLVFVIAWLLFPVTSLGFFLLWLGMLYLVQVEKWGREIERRRIASAERRKMNTRRTFDEGETARWLNEAIKGIWPVCMEKFASKHFFGPMAHFLDKYKPTWIVKEAKMDIESLRLGSRPPVFNFIRALEKPPDGDHVAYEADMDFLASNDMNAEMSVLMRGGARTTFYISNLHIEGKVRISVKFLKGWPVVSRVRFCFASTPHVTMSYTPYYKNFPDVSLIPMVANVVMKTLDSAMVDSIVEPNMLVVDIEALASMLSPDSQGAPASYVPKVENKPTLLVEILGATDLKVADRNGYSDPFVDIQFGLHRKKTKYIKKTLNPKWENEQHQFTIVSWDMPNLLTLRMRDWNRLRPSYDLGIYTVSVNELYQDGKLHDDGTLYEYGKKYVFNRRLEKVSRGYLQFAITVNHTRPPQAFEEPGTSDAVRETVTQEIQSAVDYAVYDSPVRGTSTEMKRSKSDTNLTKLATTLPKRLKGKSKQSSQTPTHESPTLEALQEQATVDEAHDVITMPYGPHGAFRIFHPGSVQASPPAQAPVTPPSTAQAQPIPTPPALVDEPEAVRPPSSRLRNPFRGFVRKRKPSYESVLTETMSERSGSLGSIDFSTELKNLELAETYHGPVRMDLIDASVAPEEPPEMFVPRSGPMLEPIMSGKPTSTAPAPNSHSAQVPTTDEETSQPLEQVELQGSPVASDGCKMRAGKRRVQDVEFDLTDMVGVERLCQLVAGKLDQKREDGRADILGFYGMGGLGKTTLCKALCSHFQQDFNGRVYYLDFRSGDALGEALSRLTNTRSGWILDGLKNELQVDRVFMNVLRRQAVFVAIDNLPSKMDPIISRPVRSLLRNLNKDSMCIVTSRSAETLKMLLYLGTANIMPCPSLTESEATNVFVRKALPGRILSSMTPDESKVVRTCVNRCVLYQYTLDHVYHPMALEALGYSLQGVHNQDPLEWKRQNAIPKKMVDDDRRIYAIIGKLYSTLNDPDKLLFRTVAEFALDSEKLLDRNILLKQLPVALNTNERDIRQRLEKFESLSILKVGEVSIAVHDLFIDFVHYALEDEELGEGQGGGVHDLFLDFVHDAWEGEGLSGGGGGSPLRIKPAMRSESEEPQPEIDEFKSKIEHARASLDESGPLPPATRSEIVPKIIEARSALREERRKLAQLKLQLVSLEERISKRNYVRRVNWKFGIITVIFLVIFTLALMGTLWTWNHIPNKDILTETSMEILMLIHSFGSCIGSYIPFIGFIFFVVTWSISIYAPSRHKVKVVWKYNFWRFLGMIFKSNNSQLLKFADFVRKIFPHFAPCNALQDDVSCSTKTSRFITSTHGGGILGLVNSYPIVALDHYSKETFSNQGFQIGAGSVHITKLSEDQFHFQCEVRGEVLEDIVAITNWERIAIVLSILQFWETSPKVGVIENLIHGEGGIYCHALSIKEILQGVHKSLDYFSIFQLQEPKQFFVGCVSISHDKANGGRETSSMAVAVMGAVGVYYQLLDNYRDVAVISLVVLSVLAILIFVLEFFGHLFKKSCFYGICTILCCGSTRGRLGIYLWLEKRKSSLAYCNVFKPDQLQLDDHSKEAIILSEVDYVRRRNVAVAQTPNWGELDINVAASNPCNWGELELDRDVRWLNRRLGGMDVYFQLYIDDSNQNVVFQMVKERRTVLVRSEYHDLEAKSLNDIMTTEVSVDEHARLYKWTAGSFYLFVYLMLKWQATDLGVIERFEHFMLRTYYHVFSPHGLASHIRDHNLHSYYSLVRD